MNKRVKSGMLTEEGILNHKKSVMSNKLPDLHEQAFMFKNTKRFQRDGGRAWIKDSQLYEARQDANGRLKTIHQKKDDDLVENAEPQEKASI